MNSIFNIKEQKKTFEFQKYAKYPFMNSIFKFLYKNVRKKVQKKQKGNFNANITYKQLPVHVRKNKKYIMKCQQLT